MTRHSPDIDAVCSISGCRDDSLLNQVRFALALSVLQVAELLNLLWPPCGLYDIVWLTQHKVL